MLRTKTLGALVLGGALLTLPAFSQDESPQYKSEASVQAFGSFLKSTVNNGVEQKATDSGGVLASYRYFFNNHHGVELNYGHSVNTQSYGLTGGLLGWLLHGDPDTYRYIPASIKGYPGAEGVARLLEARGFVQVEYKAVLGGLMTIHIAHKTGGA